MSKHLFKTVEEALRAVLNLAEHEHIMLDSNLRDDLGLDSMSTLSFLIILEEKIDNFVVDPDTLDANDLKTVRTVLEYVARETMNIDS